VALAKKKQNILKRTIRKDRRQTEPVLIVFLTSGHEMDQASSLMPGANTWGYETEDGCITKRNKTVNITSAMTSHVLN